MKRNANWNVSSLSALTYSQSHGRTSVVTIRTGKRDLFEMQFALVTVFGNRVHVVGRSQLFLGSALNCWFLVCEIFGRENGTFSRGFLEIRFLSQCISY